MRYIYTAGDSQLRQENLHVAGTGGKGIFRFFFIYFHETIDFSLTSVTSSHVQIWKIVTKIWKRSCKIKKQQKLYISFIICLFCNKKKRKKFKLLIHYVQFFCLSKKL